MLLCALVQDLSDIHLPVPAVGLHLHFPVPVLQSHRLLLLLLQEWTPAIFVVVRGTAPVKVSEEEPELSVEQLLATTKENQSLDDIEFSDKSETRKLIEKFVDENPEAVAQLLRNWLNDEWDV